MEAAEESDAPCLSTSVIEVADRIACTELYNILLMNEGLEAWRQSCLLFEPRIRARYAGLLAKVLSFKMSGDVGERLEAWERLVLRWHSQSKETLSNNLRI
eukprot:264378-Karenia_brevis.AAC.1